MKTRQRAKGIKMKQFEKRPRQKRQQIINKREKNEEKTLKCFIRFVSFENSFEMKITSISCFCTAPKKKIRNERVRNAAAFQFWASKTNSNDK